MSYLWHVVKSLTSFRYRVEYALECAEAVSATAEAFSAVFEGPHLPYRGDGTRADRLRYLDALADEIRLARAFVKKMAT